MAGVYAWRTDPLLLLLLCWYGCIRCRWQRNLARINSRTMSYVGRLQKKKNDFYAFRFFFPNETLFGLRGRRTRKKPLCCVVLWMATRRSSSRPDCVSFLTYTITISNTIVTTVVFVAQPDVNTARSTWTRSIINNFRLIRDLRLIHFAVYTSGRTGLLFIISRNNAAPLHWSVSSIPPSSGPRTQRLLFSSRISLN